jgi:hypothetical protein
MARMAGSLIVGFLVWTGVWLGGNLALHFPDADSATLSPKQLAMLLALSVACSMAAGVSAGLMMGGRAGLKKSALILGLLLLAVGIAVQASVWNVMPLWYHATFLALLVPVTMVTSRIVGRPRVKEL